MSAPTINHVDQATGTTYQEHFNRIMSETIRNHVDKMIEEIQAGTNRIEFSFALTKDQLVRIMSALADNETVTFVVFYNGSFSDETLTVFCDF